MSQLPSPATAALIDELDQLEIQLWLDGGDVRCGGRSDRLTENLIARLRAAKPELINYLQTASNASPDVLSFAQQRLWLLEQIPHEAGVYHVPVAIKLTGHLDSAALLRALRLVIQQHEVLRTRYPAPNGEPSLDLLPMSAVELALQPWETPVTDEQLRTRLQQDASAHFQLTEQPPIRARLYQLQPPAAHSKQPEHVLSLVIHHIACDAWSLDILVQELVRHYQQQILSPNSQPPAQTLSYKAFASWQRHRLQGPLLNQQLEFWRTQLDQLPILELPTDFPRPKVQQHEGALAHFELPETLVSRLRALANAQSATLFMTLLAAFKLLLSRYSDQWDLAIGTPISNRQQHQFEGLIGLFVNTLVLRTQIDPQASFCQLLDQVRQTTLAAMAHQDLPFEQLIEALKPERDMSRNPVFQVKFRLENPAVDQLAVPGLTLQRLPQTEIKAKLDLSMDLYETGNKIVGALEYNTSLFSAATMERMAAHFQTLLQSLCAQPQAPVFKLPVLTDQQRQQQLCDWNRTQVPFNEVQCFHQLVEQVAAQQADAIALTFDDGEHCVDLSYHQLNLNANQLAHWLRVQGVKPDDVIAICVPRSINMIVAMLGVMKAGAAYLPLDTNYPAARLSYMLETAAAKIILSESTVELPAVGSRLNLDSQWPAKQASTNPEPWSGPGNLAYLIFTSGSTGQPKGVMIEHQGLVNLTEDKLRKCDVRAGDCVLQFFSFSFDASIPEIIMPLAIGGRLLLAPANLLLPGNPMRDLMVRQRVSHITITPSALVSLPEHDYPDLRMVLVGGEAPTPELIEHWTQTSTGTTRTFINAYGPTETTVNASMVPCGNGQPLAATLRPSANKQLYVLDSRLELLPIGAVGELYIAGVGLARGYLNRADQTAHRFIPNPFNSGGENPAGQGSTLMYKTGDLAQLRPDGAISLVGRADHQVKIRGYRVELGDVEHRLRQHPKVSAAAVIAVDEASQRAPGANKRMLAFAVARDQGTDQPSAVNMKHFVAEQLPTYMVPSSFYWLQALPLTPNGKLDTSVLAGYASQPEPGATVVPPRNETEQQVAGLYAELLGQVNIGSDTDFFEAGGHSLLATQLVARLLELYQVEINVMDLFEAPTVAGLAQRIEHKLKLARLQQATASDTVETEEIEL